MLNTTSLDDLAARIGKVIESSPAKDLERNVKALLQAGLARLDVVPRQEFDTQAHVLLRTRELLEALEARVAQLEARLGETAGVATSATGSGPAPQSPVAPESTTPDL